MKGLRRTKRPGATFERSVGNSKRVLYLASEGYNGRCSSSSKSKALSIMIGVRAMHTKHSYDPVDGDGDVVKLRCRDHTAALPPDGDGPRSLLWISKNGLYKIWILS